MGRKRQASVNLLTEDDYARMRAVVTHDVEISIEGWAMFLTLILGRTVDEDRARDLIGAYNARVVLEAR